MGDQKESHISNDDSAISIREHPSNKSSLF